MTRNSCRNPWINQIDVSFAQSLGALRYPEPPGPPGHHQLRQPAEQELGQAVVLGPERDLRPDLQRDGRADADGQQAAGHAHVEPGSDGASTPSTRGTSCSTPTTRRRTTGCSCRFATASNLDRRVKRRARVIPGPSSFCSTWRAQRRNADLERDLTEGAGHSPLRGQAAGQGRGAGEEPLTDPRKWHTIRAQPKLVVICRLLPPR